MRRALAILALLAPLAAQGAVRPPSGSVSDRIDALAAMMPPTVISEIRTVLDSARMARAIDPGETFLSAIPGHPTFLVTKKRNGTVVSFKAHADEADPVFAAWQDTARYVYRNTDSTLSRTGALQKMLALNLGSANTWTAQQSFPSIRLKGASSGDYVTMQAHAFSGTYTATWPATAGTNTQFLQTNGSGALSWATALTAETDGVVGNEVTNVTNTTLTRAGSGTGGDPYTVALNIDKGNNWTATQSFPSIRLKGETSGNYVTFDADSSTATWRLMFPANDGDASQFLQTNGSGVTSWATAVTSEVDGVVGNEVTNATDGTLTRSGSGTGGAPYTLGINLSNANSWAAIQSFGAGTGWTIPVYDNGGVPNPPSDANCDTAYGTPAVGTYGPMKDTNDNKIYMVQKRATNDWVYWLGTNCP